MNEYIKPYVEVTMDDVLKAMIVRFKGFIDFDDFKELVAYEYKTIKDQQLTKVLIDLRKIPVYSQGMAEYVNDEWFPHVSKLGVKHIAFIVPGSIIGKMSMEKAHAATKEIAGITVVHFEDTESAKNWLESV